MSITATAWIPPDDWVAFPDVGEWIEARFGEQPTCEWIEDLFSCAVLRHGQIQPDAVRHRVRGLDVTNCIPAGNMPPGLQPTRRRQGGSSPDVAVASLGDAGFDKATFTVAGVLKKDGSRPRLVIEVNWADVEMRIGRIIKKRIGGARGSESGVILPSPQNAATSKFALEAMTWIAFRGDKPELHESATVTDEDTRLMHAQRELTAHLQRGQIVAHAMEAPRRGAYGGGARHRKVPTNVFMNDKLVVTFENTIDLDLTSFENILTSAGPYYSDVKFMTCDVRSLWPPKGTSPRQIGRPAVEATIFRIFDERRKKECPLGSSRQSEAEAILAAWPSVGPPKPQVDTVAGKISKLWPPRKRNSINYK